jgi:hypothetical protein
LLAISGNDTNRVFDISNNQAVSLSGLTISHGKADPGGGPGGGAIFNDAHASLSITGSLLTNNSASTAVSFNKGRGGGGGGAIFNANGAYLSVTGSTLSGNQTVTSVGFDNFGGAIYNLGGTATIIGCTLANNVVSGGASSTDVGGSAGGAVENGVNATLTLKDSYVTNNRAVSANNIDPSLFNYASGGALDNQQIPTPTETTHHDS